MSNALDQYKTFMQALFAPSDTVCFTYIKEGSVHQEFVRAENTFTPSCFKLLQDNNETFNVYVGMNPFKPELVGQSVGRTKDNVAEVKRLFADADENGAAVLEKIQASTVTPPPNVILESSPGKFQFMWNVSGLTKETAEPLLKALAEQFDTDPAVAEIARVLRVPGLKNRKYPEAPEVKIVGDIDNGIYDYRAEFSLTVKETTAQKDVVRRDGNEQIPHGSMHPALLQELGHLRGRGYDLAAAEKALVAWAEINCAPPVDFDKVRQMVRSSKDWQQGEPLGGDLVLNQAPKIGLATTPEELEAVKALAEKQAAEAAEANKITPEMLEKEFPSYDGQEAKDLPMLIEDFMPEGVTFFGSLPGTGKTWCGLSVTKALTTGEALWNVFPVKEQVAVLYLIPEASDASFKRRLKKLSITQDKTLFRFRTISQGQTRPLNDRMTVAVVQQLSDNGRRKVLVIVDTAVRFLRADDENKSMENSLVADSEMLRANGASVLFQHHSPKASKEAAELTLENVLRGTGDFGAMADAVYGLRRDDSLYAYGEGPEELEVVCVKARDMENSPLPFRLALSRRPKVGEPSRPVSVIDETGNLQYIGHDSLKEKQAKLLSLTLAADPFTSHKELTQVLKMKRDGVKDFCKLHGWHQVPETVFGADGEPEKTARGTDKKRFRWTQQITLGKAEQEGEPGEIGEEITVSLG
jgi:hypothetical protein